MKGLLIVLVASVIGTASILHSNAEPAKDKQTQCVKREDLSKDELKHYRKFKGICRPKVNGMGYACIKKGVFEKSNCVGMKVVSDHTPEHP